MIRQILGLCLLAVSSTSWARGASPYLPLNLAPEIERQIERVLILADRHGSPRARSRPRPCWMHCRPPVVSMRHCARWVRTLPRRLHAQGRAGARKHRRCCGRRWRCHPAGESARPGEQRQRVAGERRKAIGNRPTTSSSVSESRPTPMTRSRPARCSASASTGRSSTSASGHWFRRSPTARC